MAIRCHILLLTVFAAAGPAHAQITFSERAAEAGILTTAGARGVSVFDFDRDGLDDITLGMDGRRPALFVNRGDGTFEDVSADFGLELSALQVMPIWVNIDNDDDDELFLASRFGPNKLYMRGENGSWSDRAADFGLDASARLGSATFGDFDSDGFLDLFMAVDQDADLLYRNAVGSSFEDVTGAASTSGPEHSVAMQSTWIDFDLDADLELFAVHDGTAHPSRLHINQGFLPMYDQATGRGIDDVGAGNSMGIAWGDPDLNGYPDAYVTRID
ncbi:MAG: VCBS repeat-containing protein, partial [Rhodothermales bacterium]|nr:VCBS repeat-containing protein [Rhodothermales bacterium]